MKRLLPLPFLLALLVAPMLNARSAFACSVADDFNPVESADVIVEGRITGWEDIEDAILWDPKADESDLRDDPNFYGPYDPIRFNLEVNRELKAMFPNGSNWFPATHCRQSEPSAFG